MESISEQKLENNVWMLMWELYKSSCNIEPRNQI